MVNKSTKTLLPKPSDDIHLSSTGYNLKKTVKQRRLSLKKASQKYKPLNVLRRLNLIRNLSRKGSNAKKKLSKDVEYMKTLYKTTKRKTTKKSSKK